MHAFLQQYLVITRPDQVVLAMLHVAKEGQGLFVAQVAFTQPTGLQ